MFGLLLTPWGWILVAVALVHFFRRRPDTFWLWIIIFGGWLGSLVYIFVEVIPDFSLLGESFQSFNRGKRIKELVSLVRDNPSAGNYEELADMYLDQKKYSQAKECYDRAISARTDSPHPFYRRAICEIELGDFPAAVKDLEGVVAKEPQYDFLRAPALLAHGYANTGDPQRAAEIFAAVVQTSTSSETYYNYALFLQSQGKKEEAKQWAQKLLDKKNSMPAYLRRRERPWFWKAKLLLKRLQ
jgi:hypothetical protein